MVMSKVCEREWCGQEAVETYLGDTVVFLIGDTNLVSALGHHFQAFVLPTTSSRSKQALIVLVVLFCISTSITLCLRGVAHCHCQHTGYTLR